MKIKLLFLAIICLLASNIYSQEPFNGLGMNMGNLYRLSNAQTRSISPENFTGEKGKAGMARLEDKDTPNKANAANPARDLGQGWKVNPYVRIKSGETLTLAEIEGPGRYSAYLDDTNRHLEVFYPAHLLGRRDRTFGRMPGRRLLRNGLERVCTAQLPGCFA